MCALLFSFKPKGTDLVNQLTARQADSREKVVSIWKDEPKCKYITRVASFGPNSQCMNPTSGIWPNGKRPKDVA